MKSNEITEGIWDDMKSGYKAGKQDYIKKQAEKMGMTAAPAAPSEPENPIKVQHDHIDQMFKSGKLSKPAYDMAKAALPPLPTKKSGFYTDLRNMPPKAAATTSAPPDTTEPAKSTASSDFEKKDWTRGTFRDPSTKLAPGIHRLPNAKTSTATLAPATVTPEPATTTAEPAAASSTLPTKAKSKINPKDIDIDAVLKMADSLSPAEKKKMLQDLLKSDVKVKAGGA